MLGIAEKLISILQSFLPGPIEFIPCCFAFYDKQWFAQIILDQNIGPAATCAMPQFPFKLQFDMFRLIAFFQEPVDALKDNKVFICRKIAGLPFVDNKPSFSG